jgi:hypothetical protein
MAQQNAGELVTAAGSAMAEVTTAQFQYKFLR